MKASIALASVEQTQSSDARHSVYRRVSRRLLPFLFTCYLFNYIDRLNVGFAHSGLARDLHFSDAVFGVGVGMFFVGYLIFELPSTLLLERFGARKTITRIMILWGLCSTATLLISAPAHFYILRILLGIAEAGFLPGIVLYLTYWYPPELRGRATALFTSALPIAGLVSGPISGWIMARMGGIGGLHNWQWLFLLEGIPSILLGVAAFFYLSDRPSTARWLSAEEKEEIHRALTLHQSSEGSSSRRSLAQVLKDRRVYVVAFLGFATYCSANTIAFWTPTIIKETGLRDDFLVGALSALPSLAGLIGMIWNGRHSDKTLERRWHAAGAALLAALGLGLLPGFQHNTVVAVALLVLAGAGHFAFTAVFWTIPPAYLGRKSAASGIGVIASLSSLGGVLVPMIIGWARTATGSFAVGLYLVVGVLILAVLTMLIAVPADALKD
jgi:ACS family phthalate transporter-like MFS transporter